MNSMPTVSGRTLCPPAVQVRAGSLFSSSSSLAPPCSPFSVLDCFAGPPSQSRWRAPNWCCGTADCIERRRPNPSPASWSSATPVARSSLVPPWPMVDCRGGPKAGIPTGNFRSLNTSAPAFPTVHESNTIWTGQSSPKDWSAPDSLTAPTGAGTKMAISPNKLSFHKESRTAFRFPISKPAF